MINTLNFLDLDSYKVSHWKQFPVGTEFAQYYIESRGCSLEEGGSDSTIFFGLQSILKNISVPSKSAISVMKKICMDHFGRDDIFNEQEWLEISKLGYIPLSVRAVPEGTKVNNKNVLAVVENTLPGFAWLVGWFETQLLRVWYPTTVATTSYNIKQMILGFLNKNGTPESIGFKLHDFGSRGATSGESAGLAGAAHLVNFKGTDTMAGIIEVFEKYWDKEDGFMPGFSIPASEHSSITSWGKEREDSAYENMITQFGGEGKLYACVSDSYDLWEALDKWKALEKKILTKGGTLVIRPDSGDPVSTPVEVVERLIDLFGHTVNDKGYKVLPDHIRVIQGDGVNYSSIHKILTILGEEGISSDNIAFGMGGALVQKCDRDTYKFAMKMSAIKVDGVWKDVFKDPKTDPGKASKRGRLALVQLEDKTFQTVLESDLNGQEDKLKEVYRDGVISPISFEEVVNNASV